MNSKIRTYSELIQLPTFEDRINYLKIYGNVGEDTFGFDRYLNQIFYKSAEWRKLRDYIIVRDHGCDLAIDDREIIGSRILIHHMNPISKNDILNNTDFLLNPEYLITTCKKTHDIIHYGGYYHEEIGVIERRKNDTCPWRK